MLNWWIIGILVCAAGVYGDRKKIPKYDNEELVLYTMVVMVLTIFWPILVTFWLLQIFRDKVLKR